jgi:hypothetical protein
MWLTSLTAWLGNACNVLNNFLKASTQWLLSKLYLLILPFVGVLKLVFDFCRSCIDGVVSFIQGLGEGFHSAVSFPAVISFVNSWFPVDEILISSAALFTFFVACQLIATIRGIKQTLLF